MSKFIELSDYDASIHRDILDALTRATMTPSLKSAKTVPLPKCAAISPDIMIVTNCLPLPETNGTNWY